MTTEFLLKYKKAVISNNYLDSHINYIKIMAILCTMHL